GPQARPAVRPPPPRLRGRLQGGRLARVPAGSFRMGWGQGHPCERPAHVVWVDSFLIALTPATNADFAEFMAATGTPPPPFWCDAAFADPRQPVVGVWCTEAAACAPWTGNRDAGRPAPRSLASRRSVEPGRSPLVAAAAPALLRLRPTLRARRRVTAEGIQYPARRWRPRSGRS